MKKFILSCFFLYLCSRIDGAELFCQSEEFQRAHVGFCIIDLKTGKELYAQNAEQFFNPASLQKIPLSVVAISNLGMDYRFTTQLAYEGNIDKEGVLEGNIWILGAGDPSLPESIFTEWEEAIQKAGIKRVEGQILLDSSCFESALASPFWEFQDLGNYYGAGASALTINRNIYTLTFRPGKKEGDVAEVIKMDPEIPYLVFRNEVLTGAAGSGDQVYVYGAEYSPIQFYRGTVPLDQPTLTVKASIPNPPLFCGHALAKKLPVSKGVEVITKKMKITPPIIALHRKDSPSLESLLTEMNHHSVNLYAEHLLKVIGQGKAECGAQILQTFLKDLGVPSQVRDGSGLSRRNLITPRGFAKLLCQIRNVPCYQVVYKSFPEIGKDPRWGLSSLPKESFLKAKTGSMTNVCNLGGYLSLPSGREYVICLFCNNYEGSLENIRREIGRFIQFIALE